MRYEISRHVDGGMMYATYGLTSTGKKLHIMHDGDGALCSVTAKPYVMRVWIEDDGVCQRCLSKAQASEYHTVRVMMAPDELEDFDGFDDDEIPF